MPCLLNISATLLSNCREKPTSLGGELPSRPDCPDQQRDVKIQNLKMRKQDPVVRKCTMHHGMWSDRKPNLTIRTNGPLGS